MMESLLGKHPGEGQLHLRDSFVRGDFAETGDKRLIVGLVFAVEARESVADVSGAGGLRGREQAAREDSVGGDGDSEFVEDGKDFGFGRAADEGVFNLQVDDGVHGGGAADRLGANFAEADVAHVPGLDHVGDRADGFFNGDVGIEPGGAVDVDVVDAETLEGIGEGSLNGGGAGVVPEPGAVGTALRAELD